MKKQIEVYEGFIKSVRRDLSYRERECFLSNDDQNRDSEKLMELFDKYEDKKVRITIEVLDES